MQGPRVFIFRMLGFLNNITNIFNFQSYFTSDFLSEMIMIREVLTSVDCLID